VCRRWRRCALSLVRLWNLLFIQAKDNIEAAHAVIERSRAARLSVVVLWDPDSSDETQNPDRAKRLLCLFERLGNHLHRVETFIFRSYGTTSLPSVDMLLQALFGDRIRNMPALTRLTINIFGTGEAVRCSVPVRIAAARVASLDFRNVLPNNWADIIGAHTTSLSIRSTKVKASQLRQALQRCAALANLTLSTIELEDDLEDGDRGPQPDAKALKHLHLDGGRDFLPRLAPVLPYSLSEVQSISLWCFSMDGPLDGTSLALTGITTLHDITELRIGSQMVSIRTLDGRHRSITSLGSRISQRIASEIVSSHDSLFNTVERLYIHLSGYSNFLSAVERRGASLPRLTDITVRVEHFFGDLFDERDVSMYFGETIDAPKLMKVLVEIVGNARPTFASALNFVRLYEVLCGARDKEVHPMPEVLYASDGRRDSDRCVTVFRGHIQAMSEYYTADQLPLNP